MQWRQQCGALPPPSFLPSSSPLQPHSPFIPLYLQLEKVTKHLATLHERSDQEQLLMQVLPALTRK